MSWRPDDDCPPAWNWFTWSAWRERDGQGRTDTLLFPSCVVALTLVLWPPMGLRPSMPLGTMAVWLRSRGRGAAPTCRSTAPAKAPVGVGHREAGMWWLIVGTRYLCHLASLSVPSTPYLFPKLRWLSGVRPAEGLARDWVCKKTSINVSGR